MSANRAPEAVTFKRAYPGAADQVRLVRADLTEIAGQYLISDDLVILASELAANAILHSRSGRPGGTFTVEVTLYPGEYAWVEVTDQGGAWSAKVDDDEHGRGLALVAGIAGNGNWGVEGTEFSRIAWFRLDWSKP